MHAYKSRGSCQTCNSIVQTPSAPPAAPQMVADRVHSFGAERRQQANDQVITRYRATLESVQASELERLYHRLPELDDRSRQIIRQFADQVVATMLDPPLESLQNASRNDVQHELLKALQRLFQLQEV